MAVHIHVDEAKAKGLILAATVVETDAVAAARRALRGLLLRAQRRLHVNKERNERRALAYARNACLAVLAGDLPALDAERLVIETDEVMLTAGTRTWRRVAVLGAR
ncbi:hypothetical protein [Nocardioides sp. L-11A]|uniref:hypothetical protein n=1 Tax=Nocardioides sp. L-11A TaxID=3043848 RepID=UPI00249C1AA9|nr:hypothetical protein QJ852_13730 [Nocardioides sp. L-11A]